MALYVVVDHRRDENQPWKNAWLDDELIEAIQTTNEIGNLCQRAKERAERVFVHRCGWEECSPVVCCSAEVEDVGTVDKATALVRLASPIRLSQPPPRVPVKSRNFYVA